MGRDTILCLFCFGPVLLLYWCCIGQGIRFFYFWRRLHFCVFKCICPKGVLGPSGILQSVVKVDSSIVGSAFVGYDEMAALLIICLRVAEVLINLAYGGAS